ncbi:MAG: hypothetical protein LQ348_003372 [Seirophora lacunosa]|nr:MAG: hypothetical protein LQ348_003372 [Seirophora lacunosa]
MSLGCWRAKGSQKTIPDAMLDGLPTRATIKQRAHSNIVGCMPYLTHADVPAGSTACSEVLPTHSMPLKLGRDHARVFIDEPPKQDPSGSVPGVPATVDACQLSDWTIWQATDWVLPGTLPADPGLRKGLWRLLDDPNDRRQMIAEETASYLTNCRRQQIGIIGTPTSPQTSLSQGTKDTLRGPVRIFPHITKAYGGVQS